MRNTVLLSDVAKLAQASRAAAGKVLNGASGNIRVGAATRERILAAARELGYQPNRAAAILAGGDSHLVGVILDSYANFRSRALMIELERAATQRGYRVLIASSHDDPDAIAKDCATFREYNVAGIIVLAHDYPEFRERLSEIFPTVPDAVFLEQPVFPARNWVGTSRRQALGQAVAALRRRGGKRFAVAHALLKYYSERRLREEFMTVWDAAGLPLSDGRCFAYPEALAAHPAARAEWLLSECVEKFQPDVLYCDDAVTALALQSRMNSVQRQQTRLLGGNANPLFSEVFPAISSFLPRYGLIAEKLLERALAPDQEWSPEIVESQFSTQ